MMTKTFYIFAAASLLGASLAHAQGVPSVEFEPGRVIGGSSSESGARFMDPVTVDFNGDGIDDIVFGAPGTSASGSAASGSVYVILGKKDLDFGGKIDTTQWTSFDYRFDGHTANGMLGIQLLVGDFNGDGMKDIAAAEPGGVGTVYLLYGGQKRKPGIYDISQDGAADVAFVMGEQGSRLGLEGCVGDFNRDGIDDLALSSLSHNASMGTNLSLVTILAMRREWDKKSYNMEGKIYGKTVISRQVASTTRVLHNCTVGDFNDDNVPDIALGMPLDAYQKQRASGSVTIIYHPYKYNGTVIDIATVDEKYGIRIYGDQANGQFGYSLAAGDFTGDGRDDLAISAPNRLIKGPDSEGAVFVFDAEHIPATTGVQPETYKIEGSGGQFGYRIYSSDVNGDKRSDLVITAPYSGVGQSGAVHTYLGGQFFVENVEKTKRPDIELRGAEHMNFGVGLAFGDVNGDTKADVIARSAADPMDRPMTGAYEVISDFQSLPASGDIADKFLTILAPGKGGGLGVSSHAIRYNGKDYRGWLSPKGMGTRSVICLVEASRASGGDITIASSDACDVQIVGPENATISDFAITDSPTLKPLLTIGVPDMQVGKSVGFVAAIPLPDEINQPLVLNLNESTLKSNAATYILSNEPASSLGTKLEWRDLDGDGYDDLILGAPKRTIDTEMSGSVFIVKGKAEFKPGFHELTDKENIQFEGFASEEVGSQWQVMDFNKDGKLDLMVRAARTPDAIGDEYATVYAIYDAGSRSPKSYSVRSPELGSLRIITPQVRAGIKIIESSADINGDGFDDLLLLLPEYRAGLQKLGAVHVILSDEKHRSGELHLSEETHIAFSYLPSRNEKILDARFIPIDGKYTLWVSSFDMTSGIESTINAFMPEDGEYKGVFTSSKLRRVRAETRFGMPMRFFDVPIGQQAETWVYAPTGGVLQTGQGVAQKVKL